MAVLNPREELVSLLRGFFSCPMISSLGKRGILNSMYNKSFTVDSFSEIMDKHLFESILKYFVSLGLLKVISKAGGGHSTYVSTEFGKKVFCRYGSFTLLHSYGAFLEKIDAMLFEPFKEEKPRCDRLENVIGSGQTNGRKFFPKALEMIKGMDLGMIVDVGCGDGNFLSRVLTVFPDASVIASDVSETALEITLRNLRTQSPNVKVDSILTDAINVKYWAKFVAERSKNLKGIIVISMWYLIHEISKRSEDVVINFLNDIYRICPKSEIILGEIVTIPEEILADNRHASIMPEFLFFHDISGQGVLSWDQYQNILTKIPYELADEALFDMVKARDKELPTGFIWHLRPRK